MSYSWFKKGTCSATQGSTRVDFSGADITTAPNKPVVGDAWMVDFSNIYEVTFIGKDQTGEYIVLDRGFEQATVASSRYAMMRLASSNQNAALVAKASAAINQKQISLDDMYEWYTSTADTVDFTGVDGSPVTVTTYHKMTENIGSIAGVSDEIKVVAGSIADVNTTASNIADVNAVGQNIASVVAVHANEANINAVNTNKTNIDTVAGDVSNVNLVAGSISNVDTVATNIATVNDVSANMQAVLAIPGQVQHVDQQVTHVDQQTTIATDAAINAGNSETKAEQYKDKADQFANAPVGVDVEPGKKSALHWAEQARLNANQTFVSGGLFKPKAGNEYPDVTGIVRDTLWIVEFDTHGGTYTFTTGPLKGKIAQNADQIFYDTPGNTFDLIPVSRGGIISVDSMLGPNVNLEGKYFFDGNKPNIDQVNGLDAALSDKFSATNRPTIGNVVDLQTELDKKYSASNKPSATDIGAIPSSDVDNFVAKNSLTGAALVPAGPTSERPDPASLPANTRPFRYNTTLGEWEGLDGEGNYSSIGGGGISKPEKVTANITAKKKKTYAVDVSDGVSKVVTIPNDFVVGDFIVLGLSGWYGNPGVTVRIAVDAAQAWDHPHVSNGASLAIGGNQAVAIQMMPGNKLKVVQAIGEQSAVIKRGITSLYDSALIGNGGSVPVSDINSYDMIKVYGRYSDGSNLYVVSEEYEPNELLDGASATFCQICNLNEVSNVMAILIKPGESISTSLKVAVFSAGLFSSGGVYKVVGIKY